MRSLLNLTLLLFLLFLVPVISFGQLTAPAKCDLRSGTTYTLSQYTGNAYPLYFSIGTQNSATDGAFNNNLPNDAEYSNANNPGRWKDEGLSTMSFRGNSSVERACFQFRADVRGRAFITVEWTVSTISFNSNTNYIELQWKDANAGGNWNDVDDDMFIQNTTPDGTQFSVDLPAAANDLEDLRIRWIYYEIGDGIRDRLNIDDIVITTAPKPLPVELSKFFGSKNSDGILLEWQTLSEKNNREFIIEHSSDLIDFLPIGNVPGNGTSNITHEYEYLHYRPQSGTNYYRLKQLDFNGKESISKIISFDIGSDLAIKSYYDQSGHIEITLSNTNFKDESFRIDLLDASQRLIYSEYFDPERTKIQIPASQLHSGIYYVALNSKSIRRTVKILVP